MHLRQQPGKVYATDLDEQWEQTRRAVTALEKVVADFSLALYTAFSKVDWAALHAALEKLSLEAEDMLKELERGDDVH